MRANSVQAGSAAAAAESRKVVKYAGIISGVDVVPVAIETSGVWGEQALGIIHYVSCRMVTACHTRTSFKRVLASAAVSVCIGFSVPLDT